MVTQLDVCETMRKAVGSVSAGVLNSPKLSQVFS